MGSKLSNIAEGVRVSAPNPRAENEVQHGVIENNLNTMYFIRFDNGQSDFLFKEQDVRPLED